MVACLCAAIEWMIFMGYYFVETKYSCEGHRDEFSSGHFYKQCIKIDNGTIYFTLLHSFLIPY